MNASKFVLVCAMLVVSHVAHAAFPDLNKIEEIGRKAQDTAGKAGKVAKGITGLSLEEEIQIGDAVAIDIVSRYGGLWRDEAATKRVNLIGRSLGQYAARPYLNWRFGVLNSPALNAFSAPGGRVFITRGLYELAKNDDELAGVLAHEIAHIDRRHALRIIARGEFMSGMSQILSEHSRDYAKFDQVIGDISKELLDKGYDPNSEYDADREGRALAIVTGYAPGGLRAVIEALHEKKSKDKSAEVFSTHPPAQSRLQKLPKDPVAGSAAAPTSSGQKTDEKAAAKKP